MRPKAELIKEGIINENKKVTYAFIAAFYKDQLNKFSKIGIGEFTENNVLITPKLIAITKKRLDELRPMYRGEESNGTV